jgi:hypothetical protein
MPLNEPASATLPMGVSGEPRLPVTSWDNKGQVKGRLLNEQEIARVVPLLFGHSALFEAATIDLGLHTEQGLIAFQAQQAERMTNGLTDRHMETLKAQVWDYRRRFEALKLPLMVQTMVTFEFFPRLIEFGIMYFSTRRPEELGKFNWVIDAKGTMSTPTQWEEWWSLIIMPYLQTRSSAGSIGRQKSRIGYLDKGWLIAGLFVV